MAISCRIGDILAQRYCVSVGRPNDSVIMGEYTPKELVDFRFLLFCGTEIGVKTILIALNFVVISELEEHTFYARTVYLRMEKAITLDYMSKNI